MRRHLNTLYVTSEGAYLRKDGANVVVEVEGAERLRTPVHLIGGVVAFGRVGISPPLMAFCLGEGVTLTHLSETGRFLARIDGPVSGNVLLRREQYRRADDPAAAAGIVRSLVVGKLVNQRSVIRRGLRDHGPAMSEAARAALGEAERRLTDAARRAERPAGVDALRGIEGEGAAAYFAAFRHLVRSPDPAFAFTTRSRRPPLDRINALLSFLYTLLTHDCRSALEGVGLDPACGFLHALRPGRPSLALDLMEELRAPLADRMALSLVNRGQLSPRDFKPEDNGAVLLTEDGRRTAIVAWQERKKTELQHPFLEEKTTLGLVPHLQAQLLARTLRGDLELYPPMVWR